MTLRFIKFQRFLGSLFYPLQRDRLERQFRNPQTSEPIEKPGKLLRVEPTNRGGYFYFEQAELEICFLSADLVRIDWKPEIPPIPYGISRQDWSEVEITLDKTADGCIVSSSALKVIVAEDGSLKFYNSGGQTIRGELPPQRQGKGMGSPGKIATRGKRLRLGRTGFLTKSVIASSRAKPYATRIWRTESLD